MEFLVLFLSVLCVALILISIVFYSKNSRLIGELNQSQILLERLKTQDEILASNRSDLESKNLNLENLNRSLQAQLATLSERERSLREKIEDFDTFSAKVFEQARNKFEKSNKLQLDTILVPLKDDIKSFSKRIEEMNAEGELKRGGLENQIKELRQLNTNLGKEAKNLTDALKGQNKYAGCWGEMVLERLLESCGLKENFTYIKEDSHTQDGNTLRPDFVVKLPENRNVIIDSKVSLVHYERFTSADSLDAKKDALKQFLDSVRTHIKGLAKKKYENIEGLENPDFVIMFLPIESAFSLAISEDAEILKFAYENKITLASPVTMLAILRTVETIWRTEKQAKNTLEIARQGGALYDKVSVFVSKFEKLGRSIENLAADYTDANLTLSNGKGNVLASAEKLRLLGANVKKPIDSKLLENFKDE